MRSLAILEEDAVEANLRCCTGSDMGHFLGHGPGVAKIHVG
jgi:hypothetical protein